MFTFHTYSIWGLFLTSHKNRMFAKCPDELSGNCLVVLTFQISASKVNYWEFKFALINSSHKLFTFLTPSNVLWCLEWLKHFHFRWHLIKLPVYLFHNCIYPISMRVGWKVHMLTKNELSNSNENWHRWDSTFPDTNCIVSFQINPHWISNSGLLKVLLETFCERPEKLTKGVLFHQDNASCTQVCGCNDCCAWMWLSTGWSASIFLFSDLAPSDYFLFPNMKKH